MFFTLSRTTYKLDYGQLMEMAGYVTQSKARGTDQRHGRLATFSEHNLTPAEESELMEYLKFMRARKKASDKAGR
jgi:HTH-type transcriptional regulator, competence development regulator